MAFAIETRQFVNVYDRRVRALNGIYPNVEAGDVLVLFMT